MNVRINAIDYSVENASTVFEAASEAGVVAREHIAAKVNGVVSAMSAPVKEGDEIILLTFADEEGKKVYRHTASHILAQAVKRLYPETKLTIGPAVDNGYYYDFGANGIYDPEKNGYAGGKDGAIFGDKYYKDGVLMKDTPYTKDGATVVGEEIAVPAFDGSDIVNVNGWTHKESQNAGRYHTYRATNIPVEALASGIKVEASYNGGAWLDFGSYSIEGFALMAENANKIEPCDYYASRYDAAKALLFYVKMIQARYGK